MVFSHQRIFEVLIHTDLMYDCLKPCCWSSFHLSTFLFKIRKK